MSSKSSEWISRNKVLRAISTVLTHRRLLNTHLAYLSERAYVFSPYAERDHPPFPDTVFYAFRSSLKIPMNAIVSGPTGGGPLSHDGSDSVMRRAIPQESWNIVCPWWEIMDVPVDESLREMGLDHTSDGEDVMARFAEKLLNMTAPCVRIKGGSVFDQSFIGSIRILSLWPSYGNSPTLQYFAWSPLVTAAMFWNFHLLSHDEPPEYLLPRGHRPNKFESFPPLHSSEPPIAGLLGIHVRRGDFLLHCPYLAKDGFDYNAWIDSVWAALPNYLDIPAGWSRRDAALDHCWPTPEAILARVHKVRDSEAGRGLRKIYMSTDGDPSWVADLVRLFAADGSEVSTSLEMDLTLEETAVSQVVDMGILTAAQVFIGNGFSSLTSNVVQIRLAGGRRPDTIYFW
ncbi:hypothetical protein C8R45DRAFT_832890 [Mycena sanguinolenta]|nr:hypothetical protein C8R45DRAFT_832890 [Mycena sanguinolenta]